MNIKTRHILLTALIAAVSASCRQPEVVPTEDLKFEHGIFVLNEGNMGSNKASIDFYDPKQDTLYRNIYPTVNPTVVKELGDVGNDIQIYGGKLYAVINVSGKVEVMDLNARRIGQVDIPNCRSICFEGGYAYVSSYAGPIDYGNPDYKQRGYVAKVDTATLTVEDTCLVGFQPNGICSDGRYLYVANSGGYMAPKYDSTLSVIALESFKEEKKITVAINLDAVAYDPERKTVFVSSLGDYGTHPAELYSVRTETAEVKPMGFAVSKMQIADGKLYYYGGEFGSKAEVGFYDLKKGEKHVVELSNADQLTTVYGIFVTDGDWYLTDARDYVTPGVLYRYNGNGRLKSKHRTGDIPGHMCIK